MILTVLVAQLAAASTLPSARALTVDTTIAVSTSTRLRVESTAGRITVRAWDRNAVRVLATPRAGTRINLESTSALLSIWGTVSRSGGDDADYDVTIPRRMSVSLGGGDIVIDVGGTEGDVSAKNNSGTITLNGGRGVISLKSMLGEVDVKKAQGRISAFSINAPVRLTDVAGDVDAGSSSTHVHLTRVDSRNLTATTVGGVIWFSGALHDDGRYSFASHHGSIFLAVPDPVNATVSVTTASGAFASAFPNTRQDGAGRGRFTVRIGSGTATVDVQTFSGGIVLKRPDPPTQHE